MRVFATPPIPDPVDSETLREEISESLDEVDEPREPTVHDEGSADWALRKLAHLRQQRKNCDELFERRIAAIYAASQPYLDQLKDWLDMRHQAIAKEEIFFENLLSGWHYSILREDDRRKTIELPHGILMARKQPDRWEFGEHFLEWADQFYPDLVRVKKEIDKQAAKKTLTAKKITWTNSDGEILVVLEVTPGEVKYTAVTDS